MDWLRGVDWSLALTIALLVVDWTLRVIAVIVVPRNRRPQTATAWLLAIFLIPTVGFLLFALLGSNHLPKRRREKQRDINAYIVETTEGIEKVREDDPPPAWFASAVALNRELGAMPLVGGNSAELLPDYDASLRAMTQAVREAKRYVHAEFYITHLDDTTEPFFQALEEAVQRGVTVRYLLDHIASWRYPKYRQTMRRLRRTGAQVQLMLPVRPWRTPPSTVSRRRRSKAGCSRPCTSSIPA